MTDPKFSPNIDGYEDFEGESYHTSRIPHDFQDRCRGKKVAIIGTGASCCQLMPEIAKVAKHVSVCQRTAVYCSQRLDEEYDKGWIDRVQHEEGFMDRKWDEFMKGAQNESMHVPVVNDKIRARMLAQLQKDVHDPVLRAELTPDYPPFCKRIAVHDDCACAPSSGAHRPCAIVN